MPSKKKKYNSRFPPARIKKIMQTDDEIGKVAAAVPVLISKCLEMFLSSILTHTGEVTKMKRAKTMSTSHLKECIMSVSMFDFLKDVVANVPDMQQDDEPGTSGLASAEESTKKVVRKRSTPAIPKLPKKRMKLHKYQEGTSEEHESAQSGGDVSTEEEQPGTYFASPLPHPTDRLRQTNDKPFHIPLDDLMSEEQEASHKAERMLQIVTPEKDKEVREIKEDLSVLESDEKSPLSSNGVISPPKPVDLTMNSAQTCANLGKPFPKVEVTNLVHAPQNVTASVSAPKKTEHVPHALNTKEDVLPHFPPVGVIGAVQHTIPSALNMTHLYGPVSMITPPVAGVASPPSAASLKDLNATIPQGSMLSFLYSNYPGESPLPGMPSPIANDTRPTDAYADATYRKRDTPIHGAVKTTTPNVTYPYNPVAEHYKRMASSGPQPYMPVVTDHAMSASSQQLPSAKRPHASQSADDDYDA